MSGSFSPLHVAAAVLILTGGRNVGASESANVSLESTETLIKLVKDTESLVSNQNVNCGISLDDSSCGFLAQCQKLAGNRNKSHIYENSAGEKMPNFKLRAFQREMQACLAKLPKSSRPGPRSLDADQKASQSEFYKFLSANGEEAVFVKVLQAGASLALNRQGPWPPAGAGSEVERALAATEAAAGVTLSPKARTLYLKMSLPQRPSNTNDSDTNANARESQTVKLKQLEKMNGVFAKAKKRILRIIESKRDKKNSSDIDNLIERISSLKVLKAEVKSAGGSCDGPNAFYSNSNHSIEVCPDFLELPEASLLEVLGHELGHSVDPCISQFDLVKEGPSSYTAVLDLFENADESKKKSRSVSRNGILSNSYPFAKTVACLSSPDAGRVRAVTSQLVNGVQRRVRSYIESQKKLGVREEAESVRNAKQFSKEIKQRPGLIACSSRFTTDRAAQVTESFSDWIASEIINAEIMEAPANKKKEIAFESTLSFMEKCGSLEVDTDGRFAAVKKDFSACAKSIGDEVNGDVSGRWASKYLPANDRVDRIFFAQPAIRQYSGCANKSAGVRKCE